MLGAVKQKFVAATGAAGVATLFGAKFYIGKKYLEWRRQRKRLAQGYGIGPKKFAQLTRPKQALVLGGKRKQVRDLERVYYAHGFRRQRSTFG